MRRKAYWIPITLSIAVMMLGVTALPSGTQAADAMTQDATSIGADRPTDHLDALSEAFAGVAEIISPSVVTVQAVKEVRVPAVSLPFNLPEEFFGDRFRSPFGEQDEGERRGLQQGQGSGVIVSADGYIITNNHVVSDATEVTIVLSDGRQYTAEVVGADEKTDLAVVRINAENLQPASFGDSDELRVGQWVVAAGNPFGLKSSITAGIVSATGRSRMGIADYEDFIQTDAAINPGNSGGPLVNLRGEVVGINTAIFSRSGGNMGVGFAIPINMVRSIMDALITDGRVVRGFLGVIIQDLTEGLARSFGYDQTDGALISEVTNGGPADRAGLRAGDIITRFNGERVTNIGRLRLAVAETQPGTTVPVTLFRDGRKQQLSVRIDELPIERVVASSEAEANETLGLRAETLTPAAARQLGLQDDVTGAVVTGVRPFSPAARAGLRRGDVITHVHNQPISSLRELREALNEADLNEGVRLSVRNGEARRFAFIQTRD